MAEFFKRAAKVSVGPSGSITGGLLFNTRITFDIEKNIESNSNKARISVYNLSQNSQSFLEQTGLQVQLEAGYGDETELIFIGDVIRVQRDRQGPDVIATLESGDGEKKIQEATFEKSFGPGTTNLQVLFAATQALGISVGSIVALKPDLFINGFTFAGQVKELLNQLTFDQKLQWSIQDNELVIVGESDTTLEESPLVTPDTGLIGFPSKTEKGITFRCLLNPKIRPTRGVQVKTKQFAALENIAGPISPKILLDRAASGTFKVTRVRHRGDTNQGPWESEVEGIIPE